METTATATPLERMTRYRSLWIAVGAFGAVGMVLFGSTIGSTPRPIGHDWWYTVPVGTGFRAHLGFYASVALLLTGWVGLGAQALAGRLTVPLAWLVLAVWGLPFLPAVQQRPLQLHRPGAVGPPGIQPLRSAAVRTRTR